MLMIYTTRVIAAMFATLFMVCGSLMVAVGMARADVPDLLSDDTFRSAGVRVFDDNAVGIGCTTFGFCDGVTFAQVNHTAITRAQSDRKGEPVVAECTINDLVHVRMISRADAESTLNGWASARGVNITGHIDPC